MLVLTQGNLAIPCRKERGTVMARTTKFQDLNNAFLFAAAMEDEETCKLFIETILGEQLGNITVKSERMIMYNSDFRCVRLDVFASEETRLSAPRVRIRNRYQTA